MATTQKIRTFRLAKGIGVILGEVLAALRRLPSSYFHSVVTDPPYELSFMGKKWDSSGIAYSIEVWAEVLRVLKPGGYLLSFGGTRTYHRVACAIEDAGFEIRDSIHWTYGQGFPKSHNLSKAMEKAAGVKPIGERPPSLGMATGPNKDQWNKLNRQLIMPPTQTDEAKKWEGYGTALKPSHEPIVLARKPLEGTVVKNVLAHGAGVLNIDGSRVGWQSDGDQAAGKPGGKLTSKVGRIAARPDAGTKEARGEFEGEQSKLGRFPANSIFSHDHTEEESCHEACPVRLLDVQSGVSRSSVGKPRSSKGPGEGWGMTKTGAEYDDEGGASRFFPVFYCAKPSSSEKNAGCDALAQVTPDELTGRKVGSAGLVMKHTNGTDKANPYAGTSGKKPRGNTHPTVKPVKLMAFLVKLVTPAGGRVLDPFVGSGTTIVGAVRGGFGATGIDRDRGHIRIACARTRHALGIGVGKNVDTNYNYAEAFHPKQPSATAGQEEVGTVKQPESSAKAETVAKVEPVAAPVQAPAPKKPRAQFRIGEPRLDAVEVLEGELVG